ncbi:MAG: PilT/PilU family type 4a pilus ATPase [Candidatus Gastranaerophilales bacterium]
MSDENNKFDIKKLLTQAVSKGASDLHLQVGEAPALRIDGKILKAAGILLTGDDLLEAAKLLVPESFKSNIKEVYDLDFSYELPGVSRFRVNLSRQLDKLALIIRTIPYDIKTTAELNLPDTIKQFSELNNGLILVTGPTGSGKSTTIASLINDINLNQQKHIITIEDPVEYVFKSERSIVSQRQVLIDTPSFMEGLKYSLRQDPDVIFIGEIRDNETISAALKAAETGHLVFATIHTNGAIQTINRIVNMFEPADRDFIRVQLASVLRGTISQKLLPVAGTTGRLPACEILVVTPTVMDCIEKNELEEIYSLVKKGNFNNMITLNESLHKIHKKGLITKEVALEYSDNQVELSQMIRGAYHGASLGR